jgi:hypothetical protein
MKLLFVTASSLLLLAGRAAAQGDDQGDEDASTASPTAPAPTATPPLPPQKMPARPNGSGAAGAPAPAGQWVYTEQYGWIWIPYGDRYVYAPDDVEGAYPYTYVGMGHLDVDLLALGLGLGAGAVLGLLRSVALWLVPPLPALVVSRRVLRSRLLLRSLLRRSRLARVARCPAARQPIRLRAAVRKRAGRIPRRPTEPIPRLRWRRPRERISRRPWWRPRRWRAPVSVAAQPCGTACARLRAISFRFRRWRR